MDDTNEKKVENALIGMAKLLKATCYYPDGHPSLNGAIKQAIQLFNAVTATSHEPLVLSVSRHGFLIDTHPVKTKNPLPEALAQRFFYHKIKVLTVFDDLRGHHLLDFARLVSNEPATIVAQGGITTLLDRQLISTIAVNEMNLTAAINRKQNLEFQQTSEVNFASDNSTGSLNATTDVLQIKEQTDSIKSLLQRLDAILHNPVPEKENQFLKLLGHLTRNMRLTLQGNIPQQTLPAFQQIDLWLQNTSLDKRYITVLKQALRSLSTRETVNLLIDETINTSKQATSRRIISELDNNIINFLIDRLAIELNHKLRKFINQLLINQGEKAFSPLIDSLGDERWFVVRNAIAILAESRDKQLIPIFVKQLQHQDARVVNEAIRALARIKSTESSQALIHQLNTDTGNFPLQIILALGALGDPIAVQPLIHIATQFDPTLNKKGLIKVAIVALGEIGDPKAIPTLLHLLQKTKIIKRNEYNEIRCQAATALSHFKDEASLKALQRASKGHQRTLATAARHALRLRGESSDA